jgi:DegV family protein with EDD domain
MLTPTEFYRRFRTAHTYPTTSQPPLGAFTALYTRLLRDCAGIVSIHVASEMTGTVRTARLAAEQMSREPAAPIVVLNSRTATIAQGFVVLAAARAAARGAALQEVVDAAERVARHVDFFATLKTLEHVHRGGRLGEAAILLGNHLKIAPILNLKNGKVSVVGMTRAWKHSLERIVELTIERAQNLVRVRASVFHADALADAEWLRDRLSARIQFVEFYITEFSVVMGAHTGPDVVGVAFYGEEG